MTDHAPSTSRRCPRRRSDEVPSRIADESFNIAFIVAFARTAEPILEQVSLWRLCSTIRWRSHDLGSRMLGACAPAVLRARGYRGQCPPQGRRQRSNHDQSNDGPLVMNGYRLGAGSASLTKFLPRSCASIVRPHPQMKPTFYTCV